MMARLGPKGSAFCSVAVGSKFYYDTDSKISNSLKQCSLCAVQKTTIIRFMLSLMRC